MKYIGLDIHKKETHACGLDEKGKIVHVERFKTDAEDIGRSFSDVEGRLDNDLAVVIEAAVFYF
ncbi:MAG: transposase [Euryarchaeota archaeon]|nr:transposase [Euryarchaeota archaeon]